MEMDRLPYTWRDGLEETAYADKAVCVCMYAPRSAWLCRMAISRSAPRFGSPLRPSTVFSLVCWPSAMLLCVFMYACMYACKYVCVFLLLCLRVCLDVFNDGYVIMLAYFCVY